MFRIATMLLTASLALSAGCAETLHKPTTAGNAGTSALIAYSVAGAGVGQYLALPFCAQPPVYPCKTHALNQSLSVADTAAYNAAVAVDDAANGPNSAAAIDRATKANAQLKVLTTQAKASANGGN